jgi:protocatechuate 3,4-dioxygenase beta subunit
MQIRSQSKLRLLPLLTTVIAIASCSSSEATSTPIVTAVAPSGSTQNAAADPSADIERYSRVLEKNPADANARNALKSLIDSPSPVSNEQSQRIREILRQYARAEKISLKSPVEPGDRLTVSGTVHDRAGKPVVGALLYVFQTDMNGHYTRARVMNEPNARLFGFLKTDNSGHYEFETIRPGAYPTQLQDESRRIPQHIHFQVTSPGFQFRNFQMVFQDDPRLTAYWHEWARKGNNQVVPVTRDRAGVQHVVCDITLY